MSTCPVSPCALPEAAAPSAPEGRPVAWRAIARGAWHRLVLPLLTLIAVLMFAVQLAAAVLRTPFTDFGRFYQSAAFWWAGQDMYGWSPAIPQRLPADFSLDGEEHHIDL